MLYISSYILGDVININHITTMLTNVIKWSIRYVKILIKKVPNNIVNHKNSNDDDTFLTFNNVRMDIYNNMCYVMLYIISLFW